jgi:hypothetical protein
MFLPDISNTADTTTTSNNPRSSAVLVSCMSVPPEPCDMRAKSLSCKIS